MSRTKRFTHSLMSGYVLLGANTFYSFASVRLALRYLSDAEFGLWVLTSQIAGYMMLVDMGMSGSVSRILIDYKDDRASGHYGSIIKTGALVGLVQGLMIALGGAAVALIAGPLIGVPTALKHEFVWLLIGQSLILAQMFATRIFSHLLVAHQRYDVANYGQAVLFIVSLLGMWGGFAAGMGVFSYLLAQAIGTGIGALITWVGCVRLEILPATGQWGKATRAKFRELFSFGQDIFLLSLGSQLVNASQVVLVTRLFGLESATVWSICTRTYVMLSQLIYRMFDYTTPALAEMMVRNESDRLFRRFREIAGFAVNLSVTGGVMFVLCNRPFVHLWTSGRISWPIVNDFVLGLLLVSGTIVRVHSGLVGQTKQLRFLRFIYFIEGGLFIGLTILLHRYGGITAMLVVSLCCCLACSLPYSLDRTRKYFGLTWKGLAEWHGAALRLALWTVPVAHGAWLVTRRWPAIEQLIVNVAVVGSWTGWVLMRHGVPSSLQAGLMRRIPERARLVLVRLGIPQGGEEH